jgi:hypothetical protein
MNGVSTALFFKSRGWADLVGQAVQPAGLKNPTMAGWKTCHTKNLLNRRTFLLMTSIPGADHD